MNSLLGVVLGVALVVGGALVFRHAAGLAGAQSRAVPVGLPTNRRDGLELKMALNRAFALGAAALGLATIAFFLLRVA